MPQHLETEKTEGGYRPEIAGRILIDLQMFCTFSFPSVSPNGGAFLRLCEGITNFYSLSLEAVSIVRQFQYDVQSINLLNKFLPDAYMQSNSRGFGVLGFWGFGQ